MSDFNIMDGMFDFTSIINDWKIASKSSIDVFAYNKRRNQYKIYVSEKDGEDLFRGMIVRISHHLHCTICEKKQEMGSRAFRKEQMVELGEAVKWVVDEINKVNNLGGQINEYFCRIFGFATLGIYRGNEAKILYKDMLDMSKILDGPRRKIAQAIEAEGIEGEGNPIFNRKFLNPSILRSCVYKVERRMEEEGYMFPGKSWDLLEKVLKYDKDDKKVCKKAIENLILKMRIMNNSRDSSCSVC